MKSGELAEEAKRVFGEEVNITTEGQCHLGAVIALQEYKDQYCEEKVPKRKWIVSIQASPQTCCDWLINQGTKAQVPG